MDLTSLRNNIVSWAGKMMPNLQINDILTIADYLISPAVGITSFEEFSDVTEGMLIGLELPPVKKNKLLKALLAEAPQAPKPRPANEPQPSSSRPQPQQVLMPTEYSFKVQWSTLPKELLKTLEDAKLHKRKAIAEVAELKRAIATQCKADYAVYKSSHPRAQKHPGRGVYKKVATQVGKKFGTLIEDTINGKVISKSYATFARKFEICVENKTRNRKAKRTVVRGKGTVGVILEEHHPEVSDASREEQIVTKEEMKELFKCDPSDWDMPTTIENVKNTYTLQRHEIYLAKEEINEEDEDDEDEPEERRAMEILKTEWPFLFQLEGLQVHHFRLTGRDLESAFDAFAKDHLQTMITYMVTKTSNNEDNMALKMYVESKSGGNNSGTRFLMLLQMLCTTFKEDIKQFVIPVEKTSHQNLFQYTCLQNIPYPCIVALDNDQFSASEYCICADKVSLAVATSPADAILALFHVCFNFDLEYPPLPLLFEFIERFIFGMAIVDTKVKTKKGTEIMVVTEKVRKLSNDYENFQQAFQNKLEALSK